MKMQVTEETRRRAIGTLIELVGTCKKLTGKYLVFLCSG